MIPVSFITSMIMGWFIIPYVLFISLKKRLFDRVDDRKLHKRAVPRLGGIVFFPVITFATSLTISLILGTCNDYELGIFSGVLLKEWLLLCCGLILIYLVGIADDLDGVRYRNKFIVQIVSALFIPFGNIYINNLYGIFGIYERPAYIGIPLTTLFIVFVTNALNLIDGVDFYSICHSISTNPYVYTRDHRIGRFRSSNSFYVPQYNRERGPLFKNIHGRHRLSFFRVST